MGIMMPSDLLGMVIFNNKKEIASLIHCRSEEGKKHRQETSNVGSMQSSKKHKNREISLLI
jgi:hypothetical protein